MSEVFINEIINDLVNIDPDLKNIKSELEKLIQELIFNKPQIPFTKDFKESLKAQIIWVINEQRIIHEEDKRWDRANMFHSIKFWMIGFSTITAWILMFTTFDYIEGIKKPNTQTTYTYKNSDTEEKIILNNKEKNISIKSSIPENSSEEGFGGGSPENENSIMTVARLDDNSENQMRSFSNKDESIPTNDIMMMWIAWVENPNLEIETIDKTIGWSLTANFCETSNQFLLINNISENTTKTFSYDNQIYETTVNLTTNSITINHIGTKDDNKTQKELPNIDLFFEINNFNTKSEYLSPIIQESENIIEYYFPRQNNQEWITVNIDKSNNIIFSIKNICIY